MSISHSQWHARCGSFFCTSSIRTECDILQWIQAMVYELRGELYNVHLDGIFISIFSAFLFTIHSSIGYNLALSSLNIQSINGNHLIFSFSIVFVCSVASHDHYLFTLSPDSICSAYSCQHTLGWSNKNYFPFAKCSFSHGKFTSYSIIYWCICLIWITLQIQNKLQSVRSLHFFSDLNHPK